MSMSWRMTPKGKSFMVTSNEVGFDLLGLLGYTKRWEQRLRVGELRKRIEGVQRVPRALRAYLTTLGVATSHLLEKDQIHVG